MLQLLLPFIYFITYLIVLTVILFTDYYVFFSGKYFRHGVLSTLLISGKLRTSNGNLLS